MTNQELLHASPESLNSTDRQRQFVLQTELVPVPCPACGKPSDAIAAMGITVNEYSFGLAERDYRCFHCQAELEKVVPFIAVGPGWHWRLKPSWLQEQLRKAAFFDKSQPKSNES